ncbi:Ypt/Rab-GAP domain of gyp1p superfamily protein [Zea mays]|uniref:Ypt/Rab-GAP domain of gyp1p superfamily protein n=1 Tax=Zea mays TaxID=4577 RepID=A0A1D6IVH6_MAIZE|nr:Ypt/Rab-GAP domain of gyp1p superfamily protein [Zea mays]
MAEENRQQRRLFANLRSVQWQIDLGIVPASPGASVDKLCHAAADSRRRYVSLRRRLMVDPHLPKEEDRSSNLVVDNPLSQNPANECSIEVPGVLNVQRLQQLLLTLATLIKRELCDSSFLVIGYIMKKIL